jgi:amidase
VTEQRGVRDRKVEEWQPALMLALEPGQTFVRIVPRYCGLLTLDQITITESRPSQLLRHLAEGTWSAKNVIRAFITRATIAHHLKNPLTDVFFDRAVEDAKRLDAILRGTGEPVGPLHGLPISLKDVMHTAGGESTLAISCALDVFQRQRTGWSRSSAKLAPCSTARRTYLKR